MKYTNPLLDLWPLGRTRPAIRHSAFTLMETLVALGVFAIGFTALASLFPVGTMLQRSSVNEVQVQALSQTAVNLLQARGISPAPLRNLLQAPGGAAIDSVRAVPQPLLVDPGGQWPITMRRSGSQLFWHPLVRYTGSSAANPADSRWLVYVMVLQRHVQDGPGVMVDPVATIAVSSITRESPSNELPALFAITLGGVPNDVSLTVGDPILDSTGRIHRIADVVDNRTIKVFSSEDLTDANINAIWTGRVQPGSGVDRINMLKRIVVVGNCVF